MFSFFSFWVHASSSHQGMLGAPVLVVFNATLLCRRGCVAFLLRLEERCRVLMPNHFHPAYSKTGVN